MYIECFMDDADISDSMLSASKNKAKQKTSHSLLIAHVKYAITFTDRVGIG